MKRPDYFVCLNNANKMALKSDTNLPVDSLIEDLWDNVLMEIYKTEWYKNRNDFKSEIEKKVWNNRVAFIDSKYYEPINK